MHYIFYYRVGIPNGIPLIFKFKSVNGKLVPIVQEMAVAPISGEFLEKKVRFCENYCCVCVNMHICVCVCVCVCVLVHMSAFVYMYMSVYISVCE